MNLNEKLVWIDKLRAYQGKNPYILWLQYNLTKDEKFNINNFHFNYIKSNYDSEVRELNRIVKIADWFGKKKQEEWGLDFLPEKLKITYLVGTIDTHYHCYVFYRQNQDKHVSCFIPKNAIVTPLEYENYKNLQLDFTELENCLDKQTKGQRKILDHQPDAIKFLLQTHKCILADDMGLGKTFEALSASIIGNFKKILVITTASVKTTWKREIGYFVDAKENVNIIDGNNWGETKRFNVINYDILNNFYTLPLEPKTKGMMNSITNKIEQVVVTKKSKHPKTGRITEEVVYKKSNKKDILNKTLTESKLLLEQFDLIIIDEAHKLSNAKSLRYQIIEDLIKNSGVKDVYALTGTPITNRPLNYYNILKLIGADIAKDWRYFMLRYCDGREITIRGNKIMKTNGASNLDELRERTSHLYLRRLKTDIPDFPNKYVKEMWYDLTEKEFYEYHNLWNEYRTEQLKNNINIDEDTLDSYKSLIENTILRKYLAKIMVNRTIELAESHIEDDEYVIIATTYDEEIELLQKYFGKRCVIFNGKMDSKQKEKVENEFMTNPKIEVFIGQELAAGVGLTLTKANTVIFNSYDWIPGNNEQMEDRAFRIGQKNDVTVYYQNFFETILERMSNTVKMKEEIINNVIVKEQNKTHN